MSFSSWSARSTSAIHLSATTSSPLSLSSLAPFTNTTLTALVALASTLFKIALKSLPLASLVSTSAPEGTAFSGATAAAISTLAA